MVIPSLLEDIPLLGIYHQFVVFTSTCPAGNISAIQSV